MIDLRKRMAELRASEELMRSAPAGYEHSCIVYAGEIPWWKVDNFSERKKAYTRQTIRVWNRLHPKEHLDRTKESWQKHPETLKVWNSTRVSTGKTLGRSEVFAPYKRKVVEACELCGYQPRRLGWHHWIIINPSVGIWTCCDCNQCAEAIDASGDGLIKKYIVLKEQLDKQYENGMIVEKATAANRRSYLHTTINDVHKRYNAWGKRDKPENNLCELCVLIECSNYHHWDDDVLGKGIHVCRKCHAFAERFDQFGEAFIEKYLDLKVQDEIRVLSLMKAGSLEITADMFISISKELL